MLLASSSQWDITCSLITGTVLDNTQSQDVGFVLKLEKFDRCIPIYNPHFWRHHLFWLFWELLLCVQWTHEKHHRSLFFYCNSKDSLYFNWVQSTVAQVRNKTLKGNSYSKERVGGCFHLIMEETTVSSDGTTWRQVGLKQKPVSMCLLWTLT